MQDRFKFRVYSFEQKKMIYSWNYQSKRDFFYGALLDYRFFGKGLFITMQSIGIKDKNGVMIFEGDILKDKYGALHLISWNKKGFYEADTFAVAGFYNAIQEDMEVIGNIYENPELLED